MASRGRQTDASLAVFCQSLLLGGAEAALMLSKRRRRCPDRPWALRGRAVASGSAAAGSPSPVWPGGLHGEASGPSRRISPSRSGTASSAALEGGCPQIRHIVGDGHIWLGWPTAEITGILIHIWYGPAFHQKAHRSSRLPPRPVMIRSSQIPPVYIANGAAQPRRASTLDPHG